jgi:hypothetical protein
MGLSAGLLMKWLSLEGIDISSLDLSQTHLEGIILILTK